MSQTDEIHSPQEYLEDDLSNYGNHEKEEEDKEMENHSHSLAIPKFFQNNSQEVPLVYAEFSDPYSFRCLIEYLNHTNDSGNFIFSPKKINYSKSSDSKQVLNEVIIYGHELVKYNYNSDRDNIISGVDLGQFKGATKKIGKKDIARLIAFNQALYLQVNGSPKSGSEDDMDIIRTQRLDHEYYTVEGYQPEDEPNFTVSMQRFTTVCADQASCKDDFVLFVGLERGIITEARQGGNLRASIKPLGEVDETAEIRSGTLSERTIKTSGKSLKVNVRYSGEIVRYKIQRRTVAALSKLTNISPNGTVKVYMAPGLPIKLSFPISSYGQLNVYLRSTNN